MVGITAALQFPEIQTKVARGLTNYLSKRIGLDVSIGHVNIYWLRNLELNDVLIKDVEQDTMIYAGSLKLIFNLSILKKGKDITLSEAELDRAYVRLVKYDPEGYLNINHLIDSLKSLTSGNNSDSVKGVFQIEKINLTNSTFLLSNPFKDSLAGKFNYNQFRLNDLNASGENLTSIGKDFSIQINSLNCSDSATSFPVNSLKGFYQITENSMVFRSFSLEAGNTSLDGSMVFQFDSIQLMSDFNENVAIIADIKESDIFSQDLGLFVPSFQKIWQRFDISGFFSGSINQFEVKNFNIGFGEGSHLKGTINAYGLPDIENTFMDLRVQNSLIRPNDLKPFISESSLRTLVKFGNSSFKGRFTGFISDFVADANFYTQIGYIDSDINLKVDPSNNQPTYSGRLLVQAFDLGKLVGQENLFQMIDLRGSVKGTGFDIETLDLFMDGSIENFGIKGYNYRNISMDGRLSSEVFNGFIGINDPNLIFEINGNINLHKGEEKINISASLDTAILHELNITDVEAAISTRIIADFEGLTIDDFVGSIRSEKTSVSYDQRRTDIENFKLISERNDSSKYLELSSNNIDFHMSGTYNLTDLFKDLPTLVKEYIVLIKNDKPTIDSLLANNKRSISKPYNFELNAYLVDINPALTLLFPDLYVAKNSFISGEFQGGDSSTLNFKASIDTLQYLNYLLTENELEFHGYRNRDSIETYATLNISSANQQFGTTETSGLKFESIWNYDSLYSSFYVRQIDKGNDITVNSLIELNPGFTRLRFLPSEIIVLNNQWRFSKDNEIHLAKRDIEFLNFKLGNEDQEIKIDGKVSQNSGDKLIVNVRNFRIENINSLITREFFGTVNGYATIDRVYTNPIIDSQFNIDHLVFQEFLVGDIEASSNYRVDDEVMDIEFHVLAEQKEKVIDVNGYYYPEKKENQLDLSATFNNANINLIEPFYDNLISDLDGRAQGNFKISGSIKYPVLKGEGTISKGNIRLNYLNTAYTFEGGIFFTENQIGAKNLVLTDRFNNTGMLNGSIKHEYFKNIRFDLTSQFQNLLVLNTSPLDNDLFYGTAFGTGILHVTGQDNNILMDINAVTNPGTKFYIPLSGSSEINQENYIQFIDYSDPKEVDDLNEENVFKLKGIRLDFDLEVTPDAYCEIIFDVKAGDIIRGRGNGKLNLSIDTKGEFNMFGDFEFESGGYNFTLYNIINKEFSIEPNSRISWSGDPYTGILDLNATYRQLASLGPLFYQPEPEFLQNPEVRRKYPALVMLNLKGPIMTPEISFDIDIRDYPKIVVDGVNFETTVSAFKSEIKSNEQELKRQVFSLIILRQFAKEDAFSVGVGTSFGNSVSEFVSNQLSYWITQIDENLEIDLDLGTLDENAANTFQYRLSYAFNEGRLRVSREGNISNEQTSQDDLSNIIGDWTLEYLLTPDGKLRAKMYNRFNYNNLYGTTQRNTTATAGFSIMHTENFDKVNEIFKSKNKKRKRNQREYIEIDEGTIPTNKEQEIISESESKID